MKKLLAVLITLIVILLIALGIVLFFPEIEDLIFPSSQQSSAQAVNNHDTPTSRTQTEPKSTVRDDIEDNHSNQPHIVQVVAGPDLTVVLYSDGVMKTLVENDMVVSDPSPAVSLDVGGFHAVGLRSDGTVFASITAKGGYDDVDVGQCNVRGWTDIVAVSAGFLHTVGLRSDGTVVAASSNEAGECNVGNWSDIIAVSAGFDHTVGLRADGTVVATGGNRYGQCNVNNWSDIVAISAGYYCTIGVRSDGTVVATGNNESGQCNVNGWSDIIDVDTNFAITVGLCSDGTVVATEFPPDIKGSGWDKGQNNVSDWTDIVAISAGYAHTVGLRSDGTLVAVGDNSYGQCNVSGLSNAVTDNASNSGRNDQPNRYEGGEFESFLSQLQYPTGPFSWTDGYATTQIENISIVEIEENRSESGGVNITFEIIGTVWNSNVLSLNVDCFDAEGYSIYSTMITSIVSDGNKFKTTDEALKIPLETVRIEFSAD